MRAPDFAIGFEPRRPESMSPPHEPVRIGRSFAIDEREYVDFDSFTGSEGSSQAVLCQAFEIAADRFGSHRAGLLNGIPFGDEPGQRRAGYDMVGMDHR